MTRLLAMRLKFVGLLSGGMLCLSSSPRSLRQGEHILQEEHDKPTVTEDNKLTVKEDDELAVTGACDGCCAAANAMFGDWKSGKQAAQSYALGGESRNEVGTAFGDGNPAQTTSQSYAAGGGSWNAPSAETMALIDSVQKAIETCDKKTYPNMLALMQSSLEKYRANPSTCPEELSCFSDCARKI